MALEHVKFARPMTHDLMLDALTNLDARIDSIVIYESKGQMFFVHLILSQGGRLITLDARPSDAIALALRQDAPLYIEEAVLDASSFPFLFKGEKQTEEEQNARKRAKVETPAKPVVWLTVERAERVNNLRD